MGERQVEQQLSLRSSERKCKSGIYYPNRLIRQHLIKAEKHKKSKEGISRNTSMLED